MRSTGDVPERGELFAVRCALEFAVAGQLTTRSRLRACPWRCTGPVIENGAAPGAADVAGDSARLLIALTVSVPFVLWFTPIVQPMNAARALP